MLKSGRVNLFTSLDNIIPKHSLLDTTLGHIKPETWQPCHPLLMTQILESQDLLQSRNFSQYLYIKKYKSAQNLLKCFKKMCIYKRF